MLQEFLTEDQGKKQTFVVQIKFQQNATWQGTITWTDNKKTQNFRSALEMLKLMDDALQDESLQESDTWK